MDPPPPSRRGRDRPRRNPNVEETASTPHNPQPQLEPQEQLGFQAPPMPPPGEAYLAHVIDKSST